MQLLLDVGLDVGVDRGDQGVARGGLDGAGVPEHAAHGVDGDQLVAGLAAEVLVVGPLDAGPAHDRGPVERGVLVLVGLLELTGGDRAEVAEHVSAVDAVRRGVGAHAVLLGQHAGVLLSLLQQLDRDPLRDVAGHRDRLVGRAVPAGAADRAGLAAEDHPVLDRLDRLPHDAGELAHGGVADRAVELAEQGAVDGDHPAAAVGHQRAAHVVDDQATGGLDDDVADRLVGGGGLVAVTVEDLHVPQAREEGEEQREHQCLDHEEAQAALLRGVGADEGSGHGVSRPSLRDGSCRTATAAPAAPAAPRRRPTGARWRSPGRSRPGAGRGHRAARR